MRTRSNFYLFNSSTTIPRRSNRRHIQHIVELEFRAIENIVPMVDKTMEELLQAPTEGYEEAIVIPEFLAENFEIKTNLLQLVQANKFHGRENDNPHTHISNFKRMTATLKYRDVPNDAIKLMLFPYSLEDRARIWASPHHGFSELTQIDTFYNCLTDQDQDSLNAASGGNLLNKTTREALKIIENKSKVCYPRNKSNDTRVNTNSRDVVCKTDDRIDKLTDQISNLVEIVSKQVVAPAIAVEKVCVTCGGAHAYYECIATGSNPSSIYAANGSYNQVSPPNRVSHQITPPGFASAQNNPNRFNQNQGQGNYFNQANNFNQGNNYRGNNFQNNQGYRAQMNNASKFQNQGFQNQPFSVPNNHILPSELSSYIKSNEIAIKTMQSQINVLRSDFSKQEENLRKNLNDDMRNILSSFFQNQPSTSGTLSSNTVPNPKGEMKAVTTRSGLAYEGPSIPTESSLEKVDEQNAEEILDQEHSNSSGKPVVPRTQSKPSIPYPSRKLSLPELTPTRMTLELAKRSITRPKGVAEDVFVKVRKFHFPTDFIVVDFKADPRVPLILGRSFLRNGRALIDVYGEEITLKGATSRRSIRLKRLRLNCEEMRIWSSHRRGNADQIPKRNGNLVAARAEDLDEIKEVNANCILMANLQQASTSGTQTDKAHVYDSDGSAEVHNYEYCYDNEIFNMFTQEELLGPIPEPHQVPHNDYNVISEVSSVEHSRGIIEQHPANVKETHVLYDS
nr:reverse transcriptase domain-containing protein [Tanacetum cinerariifolium]